MLLVPTRPHRPRPTPSTLSANDWQVLFYFSFIKANYASACDGTLLESLRGEHALGEWRDWLSADGPDVGG